MKGKTLKSIIPVVFPVSVKAPAQLSLAVESAVATTGANHLVAGWGAVLYQLHYCISSHFGVIQ
jgi:hypothetical protein